MTQWMAHLANARQESEFSSSQSKPSKVCWPPSPSECSCMGATNNYFKAMSMKCHQCPTHDQYLPGSPPPFIYYSIIQVSWTTLALNHSCNQCWILIGWWRVSKCNMRLIKYPHKILIHPYNHGNDSTVLWTNAVRHCLVGFYAFRAP